MKKSSKSKNKAGAAPKVDPYLEGLMGKLLERLVGVEKKLDTVITQTAGAGQSALSRSPEAKQPPRKDRTMYEAICADCHKVCEVPFRPSEDRPVYCKECFAKRKLGGSGMPVLTPVVLPPKPIGKLGSAYPPFSPQTPVKKTKKLKPAKKAKKKK